jgi:hypothetical protein
MPCVIQKPTKLSILFERIKMIFSARSLRCLAIKDDIFRKQYHLTKIKKRNIVKDVIF